ncbi:MAG: response regulator [Gemmatimonadaceae bacterium]|nr:response regulator [Gemmatimonadaceae bacterium]
MSLAGVLRPFVPVLSESGSPRLYQSIGPLAAVVCVVTYALTMLLLHVVLGEPFVPAGVTNAVATAGSLVALAVMRRGRAHLGARLLLVTVVIDTVVDMFVGPAPFYPVMVFIPNVVVGACLLLGARDALLACLVYAIAIPLSVPWREVAAAGFLSSALVGVVMTELACAGALMLVVVSRHTILELARRSERLAARLGVMIDRAPDGIVVIDEAGIVLHANPAATRTLAPHVVAAHSPLAPLLLNLDGRPADVAYLRGACEQLLRAYVRESGRDLAITGAYLELGGEARSIELMIRDVSPRPRDTRDTRDARDEEVSDAIVPPPAMPRQRRALVVDDEAPVREVLLRQLQRLGWAATLCASGHEALRVLEQMEPGGELIDLVLSDVRMPSMDGGELARRVRALRPSTPIILMSGDTAGLTRDLVLPGRPWIALPKPFDADQLARAIDVANGATR